MKRRAFIAAVGSGAIVTPGIGQAAQDAAPPAGFLNSKVAIGRGVYAEAKFPARAGSDAPRSKVPGTMVCLTLGIPATLTEVYVTLFVQYQNGNQWAFVPCDPAFAAFYEYKGALRDISEQATNGLRISLFVPDAAHFLQANVAHTIRPVIRFWTTDRPNKLLRDLDHVLPSETVVPQMQNRQTISFARGDENPPLEVYDLVTKDYRRI
jgi:hypothetical protein